MLLGLWLQIRRRQKRQKRAALCITTLKHAHRSIQTPRQNKHKNRKSFSFGDIIPIRSDPAIYCVDQIVPKKYFPRNEPVLHSATRDFGGHFSCNGSCSQTSPARITQGKALFDTSHFARSSVFVAHAIYGEINDVPLLLTTVYPSSTTRRWPARFTAPHQPQIITLRTPGLHAASCLYVSKSLQHT